MGAVDAAVPGVQAEMTSGDIVNALRDHYDPKAYAMLTEVRNATGFGGRTRTADALVMSLWPSRGIHLIGFEVKVSRNDFAKELADPSKAEEFARFCAQWFIAAPKGLIKPEELPPGWGLCEVAETGKVRFVKPSPPREPEPPTWDFVASIFRDVQQGWTPKSLVNKEIEDRIGSAVSRAEQRWKYDKSGLEQTLARLRETVAKFEEKAGVKIGDGRSHSPWSDPAKRGEAFKILLDWEAGQYNLPQHVTAARAQLERIVQEIRELEEIERLMMEVRSL